MSQSIVLTGAQVKVYLGESLLHCQAISYSVDYGMEPRYGVDSLFPQEIVPTKVSVKGTCNVLFTSVNGGLQGQALIPRITQILYAPYQGLRIQDRKTKVNLFACPQVSISNVQTSITTKGNVRVSFSFVGIVPYDFMDLN